MSEAIAMTEFGRTPKTSRNLIRRLRSVLVFLRLVTHFGNKSLLVRQVELDIVERQSSLDVPLHQAQAQPLSLRVGDWQIQDRLDLCEGLLKENAGTADSYPPCYARTRKV
jgi:hypothetical protein